jgi:hypothetical protein
MKQKFKPVSPLPAVYMSTLDLIIEKLESAYSPGDAIDTFVTLSKQISCIHEGKGNLPWSYAGYFFSFKLSSEVLKLQREYYDMLAHLNLKCAPKFISTIFFSEYGGVNILYIPELLEQDLTRCSNIDDVSDTALEQLQRDLFDLAKSGWYHPWALESIDHWYIHPALSNIIIFSWDCLRPINDNELALIRDDFFELIMSFR